MNIKALITTLVLGSSTLAVVAPTLASADVRDHRTEEVSPSIRDHRTEYAPPVAAQVQLQARADWHRPMQRPVFVPAPVTLASSTKLSGRDVIRVSNTRAFTKLELKSNGGRTKLDKVMIQFGNGQMQTIDCAKQLSGQESFSIDLAGNARNIKKIVLVGSSGRRGSLDVIAV
jgi:hypothetical protein